MKLHLEQVLYQDSFPEILRSSREDKADLSQQQCVRRINENDQTGRKALVNSNFLVALTASKGAGDETGAMIVKPPSLDPIGRSIQIKRTWLLHRSHRKYVV